MDKGTVRRIFRGKSRSVNVIVFGVFLVSSGIGLVEESYLTGYSAFSTAGFVLIGFGIATLANGLKSYEKEGQSPTQK